MEEAGAWKPTQLCEIIGCVFFGDPTNGNDFLLGFQGGNQPKEGYQLKQEPHTVEFGIVDLGLICKTVLTSGGSYFCRETLVFGFATQTGDSCPMRDWFAFPCSSLDKVLLSKRHFEGQPELSFV